MTMAGLWQPWTCCNITLLFITIILLVYLQFLPLNIFFISQLPPNKLKVTLTSLLSKIWTIRPLCPARWQTLPKANNRKWVSKVWIHFNDECIRGREIPIVFMQDGKPNYIFNQWIYSLVEAETTPRTLTRLIDALCQLYAYTMECYPYMGDETTDHENLIIGFCGAKLYGTGIFCNASKNSKQYGHLHTLGFDWKPTSRKSLRLTLNAINQFDRWQQVYYKAKPLSTVETRIMSAAEIVHDFAVKKDKHFLSHLFTAWDHTKKVYLEQQMASSRGAYRGRKIDGFRKNAFPYNRFVELVEAASNPRDKMILLLMGGSSLRKSEPLHILSEDVHDFDEFGMAKVRFDDPVLGLIKWRNKDSQLIGTRDEYFKAVWKNKYLFQKGHKLRDLMPRNRYGKPYGDMHAGFKGMTFGEGQSSEATSGIDFKYLYWLHPQVGAYFYDCYRDYLNNCIFRNWHTKQMTPSGWPYHPWLFIKLDRNDYGEPLTIAAINKMFKKLLVKIGMKENDFGPHSLRHMYGMYMTNVNDMKLELIQLMMHHGSITSTMKYAKPTPDRLRSEMMRSFLNHHPGISSDVLEEELFKLKLKPLICPEHWTNKYHQSYMFGLKTKSILQNK